MKFEIIAILFCSEEIQAITGNHSQSSGNGLDYNAFVSNNAFKIVHEFVENRHYKLEELHMNSRTKALFFLK